MAASPETWSTHVARIAVRSWRVPGTHISGTIGAEPWTSSPSRRTLKPSSEMMWRARDNMTQMLVDRAAIVTGGAGGLGAATVRRLAAAGLGVVVFDRAGDRADALAAALG